MFLFIHDEFCLVLPASQGLANAEKRVELLSAQVATLEEEVRSRDMLLRDVKNDMVRSTDALKLAAQIKQVNNLPKLP